MRWLSSMVTAMVIVAGTVLPARAGSPDAGGAGSASASSDGTKETLTPVQRLERAESAFRNAEFERIPTLLRPTLEPDSRYDVTDREIRARELLGVGYYLTAQRVTDAKRRDKLLDRARTQFLELLRVRPDYRLDPMVFPASVVDLFEQVRQANAEELQRIRNKKQSTSNPTTNTSTPIYIERSYERRPFALNFLPLGVGQFQNGDPVRGGLYAAGQVAAIGTIGVGSLAIRSLRNPETGRFERGDVFLQARSWRQAQWIAAGAFALIYAASVVDAVLSYRQVGDVEVRTLDEPPPELESDSPDSSSAPIIDLRPGGLSIRW